MVLSKAEGSGREGLVFAEPGGPGGEGGAPRIPASRDKGIPNYLPGELPARERPLYIGARDGTRGARSTERAFDSRGKDERRELQARRSKRDRRPRDRRERVGAGRTSRRCRDSGLLRYRRAELEFRRVADVAAGIWR